MTMRRPGAVRWARTRDCRPPVVMTPGRVQPGRGQGRSLAPVASRMARGSRMTAAPSRTTPTPPADDANHTVDCVQSSAPDRASRPASAAPSANWRSDRRLSSATASGLKYWRRPSPSRRRRRHPRPLRRASRRPSRRPVRRRRRARRSSAVRAAPQAARRGRPGLRLRARRLETACPAAAFSRQARTPVRPSTVTMQSKQLPMPQWRPRGAPLACGAAPARHGPPAPPRWSRPCAPRRRARRN